MTQKLLKLKRNLLIIIMTNITTPEFNTLAVDVCNARLAQANLLKQQILMLNCRVLTGKLRQIKQKIYLLKITLKS